MYFESTLTLPAAVAASGGALLGAVIGSFLGVVLLRWPRGEAVAAGRSHCDRCAAPLGPGELVPVLSYCIQRGRCRRCGGRITPAHLAMELGAAAIGAISCGLFVDAPLLAASAALLGWTLLLLAALDLTAFWLPDRLTLPLGLGGLGAAALGLGPGLVTALAGAAAGYLALAGVALAYRWLRGREGLGGGDPKLFAAIGAWLGWEWLPLVLLGACALGLGAVAVLRLAGRRIDVAKHLPLGAMLAAAAWPLWLAGHA